MRKCLLTLSIVLSILLVTGCKEENKKIENHNEKITENKQKKEQTYKIGINQFADHPSLNNCKDGFIEGLKQEGFIEGDNISIQYQNGQADMGKTNSISGAFVSQDVDLICAIATPSAQSSYNNTMESDIPVVFTAVSDPVKAEIVKSLEKPENNVTGTADALPVEAQLQLIRALLPEAKKIGILYTLSEINGEIQIAEYKRLASKYGFEIIEKGIQEQKDIQSALDVLLMDVDCLTNILDNTVVNSLALIIDKSIAAGIPVFGSEEEQVRNGCLGAEGIDYFALGVETGKMAARILQGEKAGEMPIHSFQDSKPFINQNTADLLNVKIPESLQNSEIYK